MEIRIAAWAIDFIRAMQNKPIILKIMFRVILGKYAYREFIGLMDASSMAGYTPFWNYELERCNYHQDRIPSLNWWTERCPIPLKKEGMNESK